jgi:hypothetical protein
MSQFLANQYRTNTKFHQNNVTQILPEFYQEEYPDLIRFIEAYYDYTGEDGSASFNDQIQNLFDLRNISSTDIKHLDLLIGEISSGLESSSFYQNPRLMTRLLSDLYRAKGTQISAEHFFKAFFNEDIEVTYPKKDIFILNDKLGGSLVGPGSLHYIQDDKRYQIFSVLLKTGISFSDYEDLYKKLVHPAGFHLAADVVIQSLGVINVRAGLTTDPLAPSEAPLYLVSHASPLADTQYALLTMNETDATDAEFILSSAKILDQYQYLTVERMEEIYGTIAEWASPTSVSMANQNIYMSDNAFYTDADEAETTL